MIGKACKMSIRHHYVLLLSFKAPPLRPTEGTGYYFRVHAAHILRGRAEVAHQAHAGWKSLPHIAKADHAEAGHAKAGFLQKSFFLFFDIRPDQVLDIALLVRLRVEAG